MPAAVVPVVAQAVERRLVQFCDACVMARGREVKQSAGGRTTGWRGRSEAT